jgi:hypothetical protein
MSNTNQIRQGSVLISAQDFLTGIYISRSFVQVGCLLSIFLLGIGPISQQAVNSVVCSIPVNGQQVTILVAFELPGSGFSLLNNLNNPVDVSLMGGIINSLADPSQNQTALVNGCSTGNCTFPMTDGNHGITHSTIGMCSKCIDITSELRNGTNNYTQLGLYGWVNKGLPNGLSLTGLIKKESPALNCSGDSLLDSILSQVEEHDFTAITPASVLNWTMITVSGCSPPCNYSDVTNLYDEDAFLSTACSIYPCMRHYSGRVDRGEFNETLVSTVPAFYSVIDTYYYGINASCVINGNTYDLTRIQPNQFEIGQNLSVFLTLSGENLALPSQCINKIDIIYVDSVVSFLNSVLTGSCKLLNANSTIGPSTDTSPCAGWWIQGGIFNFGNATLNTVQRTFNSVVESITNKMRVQGYDPRTNSTGLVYGTVYQTTTCIAFSWTWLLFPALLIILTGICLVITMIHESADLRDGNSIMEIFDLTSSICKSRNPTYGIR